MFEMTYLREWHIFGTKIVKIPEFIAMFQDMRILDIPKNCLDKLPPEIGNLRPSVILNQKYCLVTGYHSLLYAYTLSHPGKLTKLRELNVSYNRLSEIPPELGDCENLERLELTSNLNLMELPFEVRHHF